MVGGHAPATVDNEQVYRFEFPERPGALLNFLKKLGKQFNISLFHYRNHGAAYGRVFVGLRSEEHTSELQSRPHHVCRLLLEKKKRSIPASVIAHKRAT